MTALPTFLLITIMFFLALIAILNMVCININTELAILNLATIKALLSMQAILVTTIQKVGTLMTPDPVKALKLNFGARLAEKTT